MIANSLLRKSVWPILALALAALVVGCPTTQPRYTGGPEPIKATGTYIHKPSGMSFPTGVSSFERDRILRYDQEGLNVGVGYNCRNALHPVAATVYVYPSPSLVSIGSPANVVGEARERLSENEFASTRQQIIRAHPDAKLIEERRVEAVRDRHNGGRYASFELDEVFAGSRQRVRSDVYLFSGLGGKWSLKYRFTYPIRADVNKEVQELMEAVTWPGSRP